MKRGFRGQLLALAGAVVGALLLALLDGQTEPFRGWLAYFSILATSALILSIVYRRLVPVGGQAWLVWALVVAIALRLLVAVGLYRGLPAYGYEERAQQNGYVFQDAFTRDTDAWELSQSDISLVSAFSQPEGTDQYGGMMFLSAAVYRYLGGDVHRPLLVTSLTSMIAAAAVLMSWAFVSSIYSPLAAVVATWIVALYPDFILLSASQMREPFIVLGTAIALYGYARLRQSELRAGAGLVIVGLVLLIPISPPFAFLTFAITALAWLWEKRAPIFRSRWLIAALGALAVLSVVVTVRAWSAIDPFGGNPIGVIQRWFQEGAAWQLFLLEEGSGWAQRVFEIAPEWSHLPLATSYGALQPFLPPALADHTGAEIWQTIAIVRSLGWSVLLILLLYAPIAAWRRSGLRSLETYFAIIAWASILLASYRAAGDQWDNPRYRAALLVPQATIAGWAWFHARSQGSPWLVRTAVLVAIGMAIFFHWFAGRYFGTPRMGLFETLGAMAFAAAVSIAAFLYRDRRQSAA